MEPEPNNPNEWDATNPERWAGLGTRITSGGALAFIALACLFEGGFIFTLFVMLAGLVMKKEWDGMMVGPSQASTGMRVGGYACVMIPCASLLWIRNLPGTNGLHACLALIAMICATDIGAYFVGKRFGRHKLSPVISPNKTWEGLGGGVAASIATALLLSGCIPVPHSGATLFWLGLATALLAQAGDLFESSLKRRANVKDSGTLLPGHGGLFDRFDGYIFAAPVFALYLHLALSS